MIPETEIMDISGPYNTKHVTHVGYNADTGEFTGLPREWHVLLKTSGITRTEQESNPQVEHEKEFCRYNYSHPLIGCH